MSKYISRTKSKLKFKQIVESEIEKLQGDSMSNRVLADIISRREALRNENVQRAKERERMLQAIHNHKASVEQPNLDEFEKEYEAFIAEQRRLKEEREAKEAAAKEAAAKEVAAKASEVEVLVDVPVETLVEEVKDEVDSEEDTTSENTEEIQVVETKTKKKSKKKVVETVE